MRRTPLVLLIAACGALYACSAQQMSNAGLAWQRLECDRMPDLRDRTRCLERVEASDAAYRKERNAARDRL